MTGEVKTLSEKKCGMKGHMFTRKRKNDYRKKKKFKMV